MVQDDDMFDNYCNHLVLKTIYIYIHTLSYTTIIIDDDDDDHHHDDDEEEYEDDDVA